MRNIQTEKRQKFMNLLSSTGQATITSQELKKLCDSNGLIFPQWFTKDENNRIARGIYKTNVNTQMDSSVNTVQMAAQIIPMPKETNKSGNRIANVTTDLEEIDLIPTVAKNFVPFGNYEDLYAVIQSKKFFPIFISGHSGNGKTMSVEQACAKSKRKFVCISMTPDTDESDLLGNYVLINGQMEWRDGPVTIAARQGAVLCIDEIDYGSDNLSCLQLVLEGKPFLLKKKGELVRPVEGFTVVATANTKGKGSEDGRYMFTNVLNEAFLERFPNNYEQDFPPISIERKIVNKELELQGVPNKEFAEKLVSWADVIRKTFVEGGIDEVISTRRLVHICKTYSIHKDELKAINLCLNRFDIDTKMSFLDLYTKLNAPAEPAPTISAAAPGTSEEITF